MRLFPAVALGLALAATDAFAADVVPCGKNHYILDEPCAAKATDTAIGAPAGLAFNAAGDVFFSSQSVVFRVDAKGTLVRIAGTGTAGFAGDGGSATAALLNFPAVYPELAFDPMDFWEFAAGLAFDSQDNLYIADSYNNRIRRVDARDGTIDTYIGGVMRRKDDLGLPIFSGRWWPQGLAFDSKGRLYVTGQYGSLLRIPTQGPIEPIADFEIPEAIAIDRDDNVYVAEAVCTISRVGSDGSIRIVAGVRFCWWAKDWGTGESLAWPYGVAVDAKGALYIADTFNHCIRRRTAAGTLQTVAGTCGLAGFAGDGGRAIDARFNAPKGIALDGEGNLFIADTDNRRVRRIGTDGIITTIAGNGQALLAAGRP